MVKGETVREKVKKELLRILDDNMPHRFSDFKKLEDKRIYRASISKYLKELIKEKMVKKYFEDVSLRPVYKLTRKGLKFSKREKIMQARDLIVKALMLAPTLSDVFYRMLFAEAIKFREDLPDGTVKIHKITIKDWNLAVQDLEEKEG
jgi:DNA-binding HxlR family transcriptional regulator